MSGPSGLTCTSPIENSRTCAFFHCSSHPARSNIAPSAVTPTNVQERWRSTLAQSFPWMDFHIRRSYCSAPVAFVHVGCLGSPAQPESKILIATTKDTKNHEARCPFTIVELTYIKTAHNQKKHNKRAQGKSLCALRVLV